MKKVFSSLLMMFAISTLQADYDQIDYTNTLLPGGQDSSDQVPAFLKSGSGIFGIETSSDYISKSKFKKKGHRNQEISFCGFDVDGSMVFYYEKKYAEAANIEIGYNRTNIHWKQNSYFSQNIFNTATVAINAQTSRMCNWNWKGKLAWNMDVDHFSVEEYSTYDCFIWGRNNYNDNVGLHIGIIALTGMKIDHVYPIVGFDWILSHKWKLNAVFPVDMALIYVADPNWSFNLRFRAFQTRNRIGKHEELSKALVQYFNTGLELGCDYAVGDSIQANVHIGETFGGRLRISNKHNKHPRRLKFKPAPYIGAEVMVRY
ncbi:MAG TPA: DUF6268 family outer membrane beta-barrel protein [Parachlamydiaceae bacterium]|nr:DUF6268 family outer membrane beta-barrel protein [Parachlamydiaceae bacterium]